MKILFLMYLFVSHKDNTFKIQLNPLNLYKNEKTKERKYVCFLLYVFFV